MKDPSDTYDPLNFTDLIKFDHDQCPVCFATLNTVAEISWTKDTHTVVYCCGNGHQFIEHYARSFVGVKKGTHD